MHPIESADIAEEREAARGRYYCQDMYAKPIIITIELYQLH